MQMAELRRRFAASAVARLATVRPDGAPHVVPVVFALADGAVYSQAIKEVIAAFAEIGLDELILDPTVSDPAQVEMLAEVAL